MTNLFIALPVSRTLEPQTKFKNSVDKFVDDICGCVGNISSLCWWAYRMGNHDCIACDIYGSNSSLNLSINITGTTSLPKFADSEPFELIDGTDALCLLTVLVQRLNLTCTRPIAQGLEFFNPDCQLSTESAK